MDVILMAVRWYLSYPLSSRQMVRLLAEWGIDVSHCTVLTWTQRFGPQVAVEIRRHRRPIGRRWYVDEVFLFRKGEKRYLYRAIDEHGQVVDVLVREQRDTESAQAFFRLAIERSGVSPDMVVTDHHQPYIKAVAAVCPGAQHVRTGLHRARGETTKCIERSHVAMRDRLRSSRGLKRTATGQRFLEGFEGLQTLWRGHLRLDVMAPSASTHDQSRAVVATLHILAGRLRKG